MKIAIFSVLLLLVASVSAQTAPGSHTHKARSQGESAAPDSQFWEQRWEEMIQQQKDEAADLNTEAAHLQALLLMLRTNSGTAPDNALRTSLQVNAELWESLIANMRNREQQLQRNIQANEATLKIWRARATASH
jgi:hypothetical protein